eukprot:scaffold118665_cov30-Tisochrysis_lutea.AAC.5
MGGFKGPLPPSSRTPRRDAAPRCRPRTPCSLRQISFPHRDYNRVMMGGGWGRATRRAVSEYRAPSGKW